MERYALVFFYLQGGGLYIYTGGATDGTTADGTATVINTNLYANQALSEVSAPR